MDCAADQDTDVEYLVRGHLRGAKKKKQQQQWTRQLLSTTVVKVLVTHLIASEPLPTYKVVKFAWEETLRNAGTVDQRSQDIGRPHTEHVV